MTPIRAVLLVAAILVAATPPVAGQEGPPVLDLEWIVLGYDHFEAEQYEVQLMRPDGTDRRVLTGGAGRYPDPEISPDGTAIAFIRYGEGYTRQLTLIDVDGGNPRVVVEGAVYSPTWTPDGMEIVYTSGSELFAVSRFGGEPRLLAELEGTALYPDVSPDGASIVVEHRDPTGTLTRVSLVSSVDGSVTLLAENGSDPSWAPDGSRIVFRSSREESIATMYLMNPDGSGQTPFETGSNDFAPRFSPDGSRIVYEAIADETALIRIVPVGGGAPVDLLAAPFGDFRWEYPMWWAATIPPVAAEPLASTTTQAQAVTTAAGGPEEKTTTLADVAPGDGPYAADAEESSSNRALVLTLAVLMGLVVAFTGGIVVGRRLARPTTPPLEPPPPPAPPPD